MNIEPEHSHSDPREDEGEPPRGKWASGDDELIAAVSGHVEAHVGPVSWVSHEVISEYVHVDVHYVAPGPDRPFHTLVTSGMSQLPMNTHGEVEGERYAELMAVLPPDWPISEDALWETTNTWPVDLLRFLARYPHAYDTWLAAGHSIPNGDPPAPLAEDTGLCAILLLPSVLLPPAVHRLETPSGKCIDFLCMVPLYAEELELKLRKGSSALLDLFDRHGMNEMIRPDRVNVAVRRGWRFPWLRPRT